MIKLKTISETALTQLEQEYVERYVAKGLSTERADRPRAEAAVRGCMAAIGEPCPPILWADSPQAAHVIGSLTAAGLEIPDDPVKARLTKKQQKAIHAGKYNDRGGQLWAGWVAHVAFLRDELGFGADGSDDDPDELAKDKAALADFAHDEALFESCGWVWWHENVIVLSERPRWIKLDEQGRLHSPNGNAIEYPDGWGVAAWHGTEIPVEWLDGKLDPKTALTWPNLEQRRCAAEILGWDKIITFLGADIIQSDKYGELLEVDLPESGRERFVRVLCATGRTFVLATDPDVTSAHQAVALSYGFSRKEDYAPDFRT